MGSSTSCDASKASHDQVANCIKALGPVFHQYAEAALKDFVDGEALSRVAKHELPQVLEEIGVKKLIHKKKLEILFDKFFLPTGAFKELEGSKAYLKRERVPPHPEPSNKRFKLKHEHELLGQYISSGYITPASQQDPLGSSSGPSPGVVTSSSSGSSPAAQMSPQRDDVHREDIMEMDAARLAKLLTEKLAASTSSQENAKKVEKFLAQKLASEKSKRFAQAFTQRLCESGEEKSRKVAQMLNHGLATTNKGAKAGRSGGGRPASKKLKDRTNKKVVDYSSGGETWDPDHKMPRTPYVCRYRPYTWSYKLLRRKLQLHSWMKTEKPLEACPEDPWLCRATVFCAPCREDPSIPRDLKWVKGVKFQSTRFHEDILDHCGEGARRSEKDKRGVKHKNAVEKYNSRRGLETTQLVKVQVKVEGAAKPPPPPPRPGPHQQPPHHHHPPLPPQYSLDTSCFFPAKEGGGGDAGDGDWAPKVKLEKAGGARGVVESGGAAAAEDGASPPPGCGAAEESEGGEAQAQDEKKLMQLAHAAAHRVPPTPQKGGSPPPPPVEEESAAPLREDSSALEKEEAPEEQEKAGAGADQTPPTAEEEDSLVSVNDDSPAPLTEDCLAPQKDGVTEPEEEDAPTPQESEGTQ